MVVVGEAVVTVVVSGPTVYKRPDIRLTKKDDPL